MTNAEKNAAFLNQIHSYTAGLFLKNIAEHYQISEEQARAEVTDADAEHLLDYMKAGRARDAAAVMMAGCGLR